jgi:hypothetical protein
MSQFLLLDSFSLDWVDWMKIQALYVPLTIDSNHSMVASRRISIEAYSALLLSIKVKLLVVVFSKRFLPKS